MSLASRLKLLATMGKGLALGLPEAAEERDPFELFAEWWEAAGEAGLLLPEACALATASADGAPSCRMVLLKSVDPRGFVFFTNYGSRKARELDENPRASMCFHWGVLQRQVRVEGTVERTGREESEAYFRTRGRGSRLGALASRQSEVLESREALERRFAELSEEYGMEDIPLPDFWGGYRLTPTRIEFWQGRPDRLHDRLRFERAATDEGWRAVRLQP